MMSDFNMSHGKCFSSVSLSLPVLFHNFTLVMRLRKFNFKSRWNTLIILTKIIYDGRFEYVPWKYVWFCFISILWVHVTHKTEKLESHWNNLAFLSQKMSDLNMSYQTGFDMV